MNKAIDSKSRPDSQSYRCVITALVKVERLEVPPTSGVRMDLLPWL